ncbi:hypothetical protein GGTG_12524 [Gaeumannomyces tritici R3-111a-1]|uniref:Zn(2)-C6 fungal-type domain-containing protein n=1 Tax=Gaeumannomyces tritici (strain R3-111a-1) TaxID=644352 RepID=J3PGA0_GAET3|nr:hypothetical protein GGTG_12524 [Gaeumannomyces tritici R3-111a-1]EJT69640.1 hypothetical protein GGTG_12524 [Gaeumannomyces tritici R3-111a-1]
MPAKPKSKCERCRADKQKCEPENRRWPGEKCDRCRMFNYACSASTLPMPGSSGPRDTPDVSQFAAKKYDIVLFKTPEQTGEVGRVIRIYIGEALQKEYHRSRAAEGPSKVDSEDLTLLPVHRAVAHDPPPPPTTISLRATNLDERDKKNRTPLHRAAMLRRAGWAQWLVGCGADVNAQDEDGMTPLHVAALSDEDGSIVDLLLAGPADKLLPNKHGVLPLHVAAAVSPNLAVMRKVVQWYQANGGVNLPDGEGRTPLHRAADDDWVVGGRIDELAAAGAEMDALDARGLTALHVAVLGQRAEAVLALLRNGAYVDALDSEGRTPLVLLLETYGEYLDSAVGNCELSPECYHPLRQISGLFLDVGANVLIRDKRGISALNVALFWYLRWTAKDAFDRHDWKSAPHPSLKAKFAEWWRKDVRRMGGGERAGRPKVPADVKDIWLNDVLDRLKDIEVVQGRCPPGVSNGRPPVVKDKTGRNAPIFKERADNVELVDFIEQQGDTLYLKKQ